MRKKNCLFVSSLVAMLVLSSCGGKKEQAGFGGTPIVTAVQVPVGDFTTYKTYPTSMEGIINSEARPKISGYITDVFVDEGQKVHKGQLLFKIETQSLTEDAAAAKANISAAQVQVDQLKPLVDKKIVSQSQLESAKAKLAQAKATYSSIIASIDYANIKSPVDGYVGEIRIRKGNLVSPTDVTPLTTVSDISKIYAYFTMNEKDYLNFIKDVKGTTVQEKIKNLPKVTLLLANGDEYPHLGTIQTINSQVDKSTGTISFRAIFDNPERILTNGSSGTIKIPQQRSNVLYVPRKATYELQGMTYIYQVVKSKDSTKVVSQPIQIIDQTDDFYLVDTVNVRKDMEIVGAGVDRLRDGMPVKDKLLPFDSVAKPIPVLFDKKQ